MSDRARIAVVIPCYNQARFLAEAIESALAQTEPAAEVIVVDDGSTDATPSVAARYPQVTYVRQDNAGLSAARNAGLARVTSRYVLFLDSDDMLEPEALARAGAVMGADDGLAFAYAGYREVDAAGATISVQPARQHADVFSALLASGNYIAMPGAVVYDAALLRDAGGFDTRLRSCEDFDVLLRLSREHRAAAVEGIGARFRRHGASMSTNSVRMIETAQQVLRRHARGPREVALARSGYRVMYAYYAGLFWGSLSRQMRRGELRRALANLGRAARMRASHRPILWAMLRGLRSRWRGG